MILVKSEFSLVLRLFKFRQIHTKKILFQISINQLSVTGSYYLLVYKGDTLIITDTKFYIKFIEKQVALTRIINTKQ